MQTTSMSWAAQGERAWAMRFGESGSDWIEVERSNEVSSEGSWASSAA